MDLPTRLREARERAGLKQGQVARTLLCSAKRLQNWERGRYTPPNMEAYRSLAKVYGVPVRSLLGEVPLPLHPSWVHITDPVLARERLASRARCSDPMYVQTLGQRHPIVRDLTP